MEETLIYKFFSCLSVLFSFRITRSQCFAVRNAVIMYFLERELTYNLYRPNANFFLHAMYSMYFVGLQFTYYMVHSVSYVYAVLPFYDVKCLCSRGRKREWEESHSH